MRIIRSTYERCRRVKVILQTHMVMFEERDVFMSSENQRELRERLGVDTLVLPQVFADGQHLAVSILSGVRRNTHNVDQEIIV